LKVKESFLGRRTRVCRPVGSPERASHPNATSRSSYSFTRYIARSSPSQIPRKNLRWVVCENFKKTEDSCQPQ